MHQELVNSSKRKLPPRKIHHACLYNLLVYLSMFSV